jgi:hypothetical protein
LRRIVLLAQTAGTHSADNRRCLRSYNELLGRISVDPTARFITSHAAVSDSLWDPVLEARGLIRSISHAGDVHPYVAGVRLERMYWSRVSEDVSEQTARSQEVRGNMASMAKAIKAIGECSLYSCLPRARLGSRDMMAEQVQRTADTA